MDYINDDNLEEIGYIKEIDTLAIVEKASIIKEKRKKKLLIICFILMSLVSVLGQCLFMFLFGVSTLIKISIKVYIFILVLVSLILIEKREGSLC